MTKVSALVLGSTGETDNRWTDKAREVGIATGSIQRFTVAKVLGDLNESEIERLAEILLIDSVHQGWTLLEDLASSESIESGISIIETGLRPGVTDREGAELVRSAQSIGLAVEAASFGSRWIVESDLDADGLEELAERVLHNRVIEQWSFDGLSMPLADDSAREPAVETVWVRGATPETLGEINRLRRLGLDPEEMIVIRDHFESLERDPTDAEIEMLAQTWSEHCAHKTFGAKITMGEEVIDGLLNTFLRSATNQIDAPYVHSAFVDNAGIVRFDDQFDVAIKAETHNHPSALEPFGGANTGVGGVVRDILGVSAKPIAVSDILCFGPEETSVEDLPDGVLHPRRIRSGVIDGVADYGNKIGVPNVAGAIVHDPAYTTTPLVFAGCLGVLPTGSNPTRAVAGDQIVVMGGAVGRDGVGGATFSSQTMGTETAEIAGSSVQIGDPIVEKGLIDLVVAARDAGLYSAITDCGAGGLSSSVGEMGATLGVEVDIALVERKYPGLAPWEVWLSEAQERMVVATPDPAPLLALAKKWSVDAQVIGRFTGEGHIVVKNGAETIIDLSCDFLHDARPQRQMMATRPSPIRPPRQEVPVDATSILLELLAHPSIRSNEEVVRRFDHEVLGGTVVRPYAGVAGDGPADGTAVVPVGTSGERAVVLGIGVNAVIGRLDAKAMAWNVVDEAIRNSIIAGADPDELSLLDNFAWGDPTDPETLGQLVEACRGCHEAALAFSAPFVSGKDSLYNVYVDPDGEADPVTPTLVITAMGLAKDLSVIPETGVVATGNQIMLVGPARGALGGSHLDQVLGQDNGGPVVAIEPGAVARHRALAAAIAQGLVLSAHDLSEGGLAVAAAEWAHAGRLGLRLDLETTPEMLFGEGPGRYLVEVAPENVSRFSELVEDATECGVITGPGDGLEIGSLAWPLESIAMAYKGSAQ